MPALDPTICQPADEQLVAIISAASLMPLHDAGIDEVTARALQSWLKTQPAISESQLAGLWLLAGDLDRSHSISQRLEDSDGSYWHGIMHRREGDYFNAKYWMRRTGDHPVTQELKRQLPEYRDAVAFVDYVEKAVTKDRSLQESAQRAQWMEWQLLWNCGY